MRQVTSRLGSAGLCCVLAMWASQASAADGCFYSDTEAFAPGTVSAEAVEMGAGHLEKVKEGDAAGWYRQGAAYFHAKAGLARDYDAAVPCLEIAAEKGYLAANYLLGIAYQRVGRPADSLAALEQSFADGEQKARVQLAYGHLLGRFGSLSDRQLGYDMTVALSQEGDLRAQYLVTDARAAGNGTTRDAAGAFDEMVELAEGGYPPAMDRLGRAYTYGIGIEKNLDKAVEWYSRAVEAENIKSKIGLATALYRQRAYDESIETFEQAVAADVHEADYQLARAHSEGRFGRQSEYRDGWAKLTELSNAGHLRASQNMLSTLGGGSGRPANIEFIVSQLTEAATDGDMRSAEALIRFLRERPDLVPGARETRRKMLEVFGPDISESIRLRETMRDQVRANPSRAWPIMYGLLLEASPNAYVDVFFEIRRISRNGFVYAAQKELKRIGAYNGRSNGILNTRTLSTILDICALEERERECRTSPLGYSTVRIVADYIAPRLNG